MTGHEPSTDTHADGGAHGYYRQPALVGSTVVFASENDLWAAELHDMTTPVSAVLAARITNVSSGGKGKAAMHPALSPDGRWVAYATNVAGDGYDVWIAPLSGGRPARLTYEAVMLEGATQRGLKVRGWSSDGSAVVYTTPAHSPLGDAQLALVTAFGPRAGETTFLPLAQASDGIFASLPKDKRTGERAGVLFFVRLAFHGSVCHGYRGGFIQQLWSYPLGQEGAEATLITAGETSASFNPMWDAERERLVFLSDRSGAVEVWSMSSGGGDARCESSFGDIGVVPTSACLDRGRVVVCADADLYEIDLSSTPTPTLRLLRIRLRSAREHTQPRMLAAPHYSPLRHLQHMSIAPEGDRAALVVKGRVHIVPLQSADSNGISYNRAGRAIDVTASLRGLRAYVATIAWGDDGLGNWLCAVGVPDGRGSSRGEPTSTKPSAGEPARLARPVRPPEPTVHDLLMDATYGRLAISMDGALFTEVEPGGRVGRAGVVLGDELLKVDGVSVGGTTGGNPFDVLDGCTGVVKLTVRRKPIEEAVVAGGGGSSRLLAASFRALSAPFASSSGSEPWTEPMPPPRDVHLWNCALDGGRKPVPLTKSGRGSEAGRTPMKRNAVPSPNGQLVAYTDTDCGLYLHHCRPGTTHLIKCGRGGVGVGFEWNKPYDTIVWSDDSAWLAFTVRASNSMQQVWVVAVATPTQPIAMTSERFHSWSPSWSLDGKWLYFLSERDLSHSSDVFGHRAEQPLFERVAGVYAIPLDPHVPPPWAFANDLATHDAAVRAREPNSRPRGYTRATGPVQPAPTAGRGPPFPGWGFDGGPAEASTLVKRVPVPPGPWQRLVCMARGRLLVSSKFNEELLVVDVPKASSHGDLEAKSLISGVGANFCVSPNGERLLLRRGDALYIGAVDWPPAASELKLELGEAQRLRTSDVQLRWDPHEEWREVLADAWRQARDCFWDPGMGEVDWQSVWYTHDALLPRVGCREELYDLIRRMYAELRVMHLYASAPEEDADVAAPPPSPLAPLRAPHSPSSLGGGFEAAADGLGGVVVTHLRAGDLERQQMSPLLMPEYGAPMRPDERIASVNGIPTATLSQLSEALIAAAATDLTRAVVSTAVSALTSSLVAESTRESLAQLFFAGGVASPHSSVAALPAPGSGQPYGLDTPPDGWLAREMVVVPHSRHQAADLRYHEWLEASRARVDDAAGGQIGYVSLRSMEPEAYGAFAEQFYPIHERAGLVIDVRHNRGGNIDAWLLERLMRQAWLYLQPRIGGGYWNMPYAFRGHMAVLIDQQTTSDAEAFAEGFRRLGLGPVLGMRTWGGALWMSYGHRTQDGGHLGMPEIGAYNSKGEWHIEGRGVTPDVVVDNLPAATFDGEDAQLKAAVELLLQRIRDEPVHPPKPPPYPRRAGMSGWAA